VPYHVTQVALIVAAGPLVAGALEALRWRLQGLSSEGLLLQPYRDLAKLFRKEPVTSAVTGSLPQVASAVSFATIVLGAAMVPVFHPAVFGQAWGADLFVFVGLLVASRFAAHLQAFDTRSPLAGLGSGRAQAFQAMAEPVVLIAVLVAALDRGTTDLSALSAVGGSQGLLEVPSHLALAMALLGATVVECGRMPADNPDTHLELAMVEHGAHLELSGPALALARWGDSVRLVLFLLLAHHLGFAPLLASLAGGTLPAVARALAPFATVPALLSFLAWYELRHPRVPLPMVTQVATFASSLALFATLYAALSCHYGVGA
jgi:formate hydrogenlyase subunit 4